MLCISYETKTIIIPMLIVVAVSAVMEFFLQEKITLIIYIVYLSFTFIHPAFLLGLPLILYDVFYIKFQWTAVFSVMVILINWEKYSLGVNLFLMAAIIIAFILKHQEVQYRQLHEEYIRKRDELMEMSMNLERRVHDLMNRENFQVNLATLNERNRIAREIHDNVGHLLTSSILQIGAVMAITKEESTKILLTNIKNTLDQGMNSIRESVHNLHEDSVDLYVQLTNIVKEFSFCAANLNYEIGEDLDIKIKYAVIAIVKEALANVIKHSDATKVTISLYEHPKLIQLIIIDNGIKRNRKDHSGMGLEGIRNRVNTLGGFVNYDETNGFKIFISFVKRGEKDENNNN